MSRGRRVILLASVLVACAPQSVSAGEEAGALSGAQPDPQRPVASHWPNGSESRLATGNWEEFEQPNRTAREILFQELVAPAETLPPLTNSSETPSGEAQQSRFDPVEVERGQSVFEDSCTVCHDADRALEKRKSFSGWLQTVRRMAAKDDADIAESDIRTIASYLASIRGAAEVDDENGLATGQTEGVAELGPGLSINGTVAPIWRGGNDNLEKPGFFADAWVSADWQPSGPLSGRVTACTSCHSDQFGEGGFSVELAEAFAQFDLTYKLKQHAKQHGGDDPVVNVHIRAGRFIVPFGAYAARSHPGAYRTLTNPLMYIMGRRVNVNLDRPPVLPMPYADEGVDLHANVRLYCDVSASIDVYAVNGLQASGQGISFVQSRTYFDNNNNTAVGGRATVGNRLLRVGGSVMSGDIQSDSIHPSTLNSHFAGADITARFGDTLRIYYEYAIRTNDATFSPIRQIAYGNVVEGELLLTCQPRISLMARYDNLEHRDSGGETSLERFTWGVNTTLPGGSLLIFNHEHWNFPTGTPDVDVLGFRWVVTF